MRRPALRLLVVLSLATAASGSLPAHATDLMSGVAPEVLNEMKGGLLSDPESANAFLKPFVEKIGKGPLGFLDDFNVELKGFNADNTSQDPGLGIAYKFGKQITDWNLGSDECGETCTRLGADIDFHANGNVAFDQDKNPDDFLDTKLGGSFFGSWGGPRKEDAAWRHKYTQFGIELAQAETQAQVDEIEARLRQHLAGALADQYFVSLGGEIGFETNQDFSARQAVYGGRLGFDVNAWQDLYATSWAETHWLSRINILDYPFAAIRFITNSEDCGPGNGGRCFVPRGTRLPLVTLGLALVDPAEDDERKKAGGDLDPFPRFDVEASFKTPMFKLPPFKVLVVDTEGTEVLFTASYRYYQEIGAERKVRDAGLAGFDFLALTVGPANGPFVRYSRGQLPFDQRDNNTFELGVKADFDAIKQYFFH